MEYLFNDLRLRGTAGVVVDSAPNYISIGASGALWGRFIVKGVGGHSGYPEKTDNAIYRATKLIEKLKNASSSTDAYNELIESGFAKRAAVMMVDAAKRGALSFEELQGKLEASAGAVMIQGRPSNRSAVEDA